MDTGSMKIYAINLSAMTITSLNAVEDTLKIMLLVVTIGYTIQKWWELRNKND
jgi:hypothetical protein